MNPSQPWLMRHGAGMTRLLASIALALLLSAHGKSYASYDAYCRQSGNPNAQFDCVPANEARWSYGGGSYPFTLGYSNMDSLERVVERFLADIGAWAGWCAPPTITPEGGWVLSSSNPGRVSEVHLLRTRGITVGNSCESTPSNTVDSTFTAYATREKIYSCPAGEQGPFLDAHGVRHCTTRINMCVTPNPVSISSGQKFYAQLYDAPFFRDFHFYRSYRSTPETGNFGLLNTPKPQVLDPAILDPAVPHHDVVGWRASYDARIRTSSNQAGTNAVINVDVPGSSPRLFAQNGATLTSLQNDAGTLVRLGDGRFVHRDPSRLVWEFSPSGTLLSISRPTGQRVTLTYDSDGRLQTATDSFGRVLRFALRADGSLQAVTLPDGEEYRYGLAGGLLTNVSLPPIEGVRHERGYYYENSNFQAAITGEFDELGHRISTFTYETSGRVSRTELHPAPGGSAGQHRFDYLAGSNSVRVQDPLGTVRVFDFVTALGTTYLSSLSQPGGSGCAAASKSTLRDSRGNPIATDAFDGSRTCMFSDASRGLQLVQVEALPRYSTCGGYDTPSVQLPAGTRKVSTQWHPAWPLPVRRAEPGRITTDVYNGQPDPFYGNALASCAPASALLPDEQPIAVLCKRIEQATTDTTGASGFNATLQAGVPSRITAWTYNQRGQVLTEDGPRTDVNDMTSYTYYEDTTSEHSPADLAAVTFATGRVIQHLRYNQLGQLLESRDSNGVVTTFTYDERQRLRSAGVGGLTNSYTHDAAGQLKRLTMPDQSWIGYEYDDAHRQIAVYDHRGNRIDYTLDNAGNRISEQVKDPSGALKRQLVRSIDALGRVQQATGRE